MRKILIAFLLVILAQKSVQSQPQLTRVVFMPFENKSEIENKAEFNWIGEALAKGLADLLGDTKEVGALSLQIVSNEERKIAQQKLRISPISLPTIASSLKVARETGASILVVGEYRIFPAKDQADASISIKARIIEVEKGKFLGSGESEKLDSSIAISEALTKLQQLQGKLAYRVFLHISGSGGAFPFSEMDFIRKIVNKVPTKAFEAYIKGLLSNKLDLRENYFKNALRLYAEKDDPNDKIYADAAIELGYLYLNQNQLQDAIKYFSIVPQDSIRYPEAALQIGLIYWRQRSYEQALASLRPVAEKLQAVRVYNLLGAIAVQASIAERKDKTKSAALLNQGMDYLKTAVESSNSENNESLFNYALALFLNQDFVSAAEKLKQLLAANPNDGEACFLLAKVFEELGDKQKAIELDNQARRLLKTYAKLETSWIKSKTVEILPRVTQISKDELAFLITDRKNKLPEQKAINEIDTLLKQARAFYKDGLDEEAMQILRKVLVSEPMTAEAYFLIGSIYLRRGEVNQAVSNLKTAIFWDNRLIDAYIALLKVYIEAGNCLEAENTLKSALEIDSKNDEVLALQRQVERCGK